MVVIEGHEGSAASKNGDGTMDMFLGEVSQLFVPDAMVVIEGHKHSAASTNGAGTMDALFGEPSELFALYVMIVIEGHEVSAASKNGDGAMDMFLGEASQLFAPDAMVVIEEHKRSAASANWAGTMDRLLGKGSNELFAFGLHLAADGHKSFAVAITDFSNKYGCLDMHWCERSFDLCCSYFSSFEAYMHLSCPVEKKTDIVMLSRPWTVLLCFCSPCAPCDPVSPQSDCWIVSRCVSSSSLIVLCI